jgi:hypothetical protein
LPNDCAAVRPATFTEEQLSMIASAISGRQALCCVEDDAHSARDTICDDDDSDRAQDDCLRRFADTHTGCKLYKLTDAKRQERIARYLDNLMKWEREVRS